MYAHRCIFIGNLPMATTNPARSLAEPDETITQADIYNSIRQRLDFATSVRHEGLCGGGMLKTHRNFVQATEGASVDCGFVDAALLQLSDSATKASHVDVPNNSSLKALYAFDYKFLRPCTAPESHGHLVYRHIIAPTPAQAEAAVGYIVGSPLAPGRVLVIPSWHLKRAPNEVPDSSVRYYGRDLALVSSTAEPFPPEWSMFEVPLDKLSEMTASLLDFLENGQDW